jgi:23S rRNA pseudouridine1911/1915/1917 synthase
MKKIIINQKNSKQRIDRFLVKELFSYTRGEIIRSIKAGDILVDGKKVKPSYLLKKGNRLEISIKTKLVKIEPNPKVKFTVIHKDKNLIVINKPAGLQVHPVKSEKNTLVNGLVAKFPEIKNINDNLSGSRPRPGIVHRLDKDTSGVMVVARNQKTFDELKELFQNREVKKEYLAIVFGKLKNKKGIIEKPIARARSYKKQTIASAKTRTKIRQAVTKYEVLMEFDNYSLVKAMPETGRMHQIRVHLAALGQPIVGDKKYTHKNYKIPKNVRRQMLHAQKIEFAIKGKKLSFSADVPRDMSDFLAFLTGRK